MSTTSELLKSLGIGAGTLGAGAAIHGAGLGDVLQPLDYPRQALYNLFGAPKKAIETGDMSHLLGAIPGLAGGALGFAVGGPVGALAGSALGGALQGAGNASGHQAFNAPSVSDLTGTEDFLPNMAVGMATDPLSYAGLGGSWRAGKAALGGAKAAAAPVAEQVAKEALPVAKLAESVAAPASFAEKMAAQSAYYQTPERLDSAAKGILYNLQGGGLVGEEKVLYDQAAKYAKERNLFPEAKPIAPAFYSRLEEGINKLPETIKSESVVNQLKKMGVTNEEIEATGLERALEGKRKVSRQDLLDHFGESKVQVREVMKGDSFDPKSSVTKYDDFQTPGSDNYRELLLTTPSKVVPPGYEIKPSDYNVRRGQKSYEVTGPDGPMFGNKDFRTEEEAKAYLNSKLGQGWVTSHWDEPNVLAHARFNDRVGPNGEKILHIEEIQSDIHQEARKRGGYRTPESAKEAQVAQAEYDKVSAEIRKISNEADKHFERSVKEGRQMTPEELATTKAIVDTREPLFERQRELSEVIAKSTKLPFDAPFKENWHELTMKRLIRHAAENGYDAITLNPGEQINKILKSGESALKGQKAFYDKTLPDWMKKYAKAHGVKIEAGDIQTGRELTGHISTADLNAGRGTPIRESVPVTRMPITPSMREQALTKGFPLMSMGGAAGGSALLAALMGQQQG